MLSLSTNHLRNVYKVNTVNLVYKLFSSKATSGKLVSFVSKNAAGNCSGTLFASGSKPSGPAVIVVHEWWGMNEQILQEGEMISRDGKLVVLVPDFYRGKVAKDRETAGHLMDGLNWPGALKDVSAAAAYLKSSGCSKVGVMGFCMGGALTLAAAVKCPELSAAAPFYGIPSAKLVDVSKCEVPLQLHFGEKDDIVGFSSMADYYKLTELLQKGGVNFEGYTYPTGHAFTNPSNPNYREDLTKLALQRVYKFMHKYLNA